MNTERLQQLQAYLAEEPDNPFLHYAVALEYRRTEPSRAEALMDEVVVRFPNYLPALQTAALWKSEAGRLSEATGLLQKAVALAHKVGDAAALRELEGLLREMTGATDE
jgi:predicted Zn-dependent protease